MCGAEERPSLFPCVVSLKKERRRNMKNEKFLTDLLYWNQEEKTIYSDAYIKIEQEDQVTEGYGFSSNQDLSAWHIKNTKGIYAIEE